MSPTVELSSRWLLYLVALGLGLLLLGLATLGWRRYLGASAAGSPLRVAKNSLFPLATSLLNRLLDLGFAIVLLKALGPNGIGQLTVAIALVGYFEIVTNFGLGTLLTREVARAPAQAGRYFWNGLWLRLALWAASLPLLALVVGPLAPRLGISLASAQTLALFVAAVLPGQVSGSASALLQAFERMELPAAVTVLSSVLRILLGLAVLALGYSFVALGAVALTVSALTMLVLLVLAARTVGLPRRSWEPRAAVAMLRESYPLMLNNLLNTLFFRIDVVLLQAMTVAEMVGWYSTAYRFVDGLNVIPSSFVLAVFPLLSRQAEEGRELLERTVALALKVLLGIALPICVGTALFAQSLVLLVADERYLPHAAVALTVLIWFLPLSFTNGLLQYVLVAIGRQRSVTLAFVVGAAFNLVANLLLIPRYGYLAAAVVTVLSEAVLLGPFLLGLRGTLAPPPLLRLAWRPALAALAMGVVLWPLRGVGLAVIPLGAVAYLAALWLLGGIGPEERALLQALRRR